MQQTRASWENDISFYLSESKRMLKTKEEIIWRVVDDEALLLDTDSGYYFSMNDTATEIWCLLNEGKSIDDVATTISERYEIDSESVRRDVQELIANLNKEQIASLGE
ncbi:MAG: PqqD family protein [Candidatus Melainabacteria bacterium]|nr:MAG: PqqD family protein [Candidatus Melainabacteria bacterium]